ncbi:MAG: EVE domain-containing protein [Planctomycetes bacterium]|nr:EVE domain-containing protein [Planctomycetota bacterium]
MVKSKSKPKSEPAQKGKANAVAGAQRYWLVKSEPSVYGWQQLLLDRRTCWDGVRNYQARNMLRSDMQCGDGVLFYHSNAVPMAIVGIAKVVRAGYPDATAFDKASPHHDPASDPLAPTWFMVDIEPLVTLSPVLVRERLMAVPELRDMLLLQRGCRLSVQPVSKPEWLAIVALAGVKVTC